MKFVFERPRQLRIARNPPIKAYLIILSTRSPELGNENNMNSTFKPKISKIKYHAIGSIVFVSEALFVLFILFSNWENSVSGFIMCIISLVVLSMGIYFLLLCFMSILRLTDSGIYYHQPLYSVCCKWENIENIVITKDGFRIHFNNEADIQEPRVARLFFGNGSIPIEIFINKYDNYEIWESNPILHELQNHLPNIAQNVIEGILNRSAEGERYEWQHPFSINFVNPEGPQLTIHGSQIGFEWWVLGTPWVNAVDRERISPLLTPSTHPTKTSGKHLFNTA